MPEGSPPMDLSIVVPTFRRPVQLRRCIESCLAQTGLDEIAYELVIVDNCPAASARDALKGVQGGDRLPIRYFHEPRPGVVHARNRGIAAALAPLLAFIDDDQVAEADWAANLLAAQADYNADVVLGRVLAALEAESRADPSFVREFYTIDLGERSGPTAGDGHTGNVLLRRETCFVDGRHFDPQLGLLGGEDTLFFLQLARANLRMIWCREAAVHEIIPPRRTTYSYIWKRCIVRGQTVSRARWKLQPREWRSVAWFMMTGTLQAFAFGLAAIFTAPFRPRRAAQAAVRALMGVGKALWMAPFRIHYYGPAGSA